MKIGETSYSSTRTFESGEPGAQQNKTPLVACGIPAEADERFGSCQQLLRWDCGQILYLYGNGNGILG